MIPHKRYLNLRGSNLDIPAGYQTRLKALPGGPMKVLTAHWAQMIPKIADCEPELLALDDYELRNEALPCVTAPEVVNACKTLARGIRASS